MATSELSILVQVKDEATSALKKLASSMGGSFKQATTASKDFAATLLGVTAAVGGLAVKSISEAQESIKNQNQLKAVLESTGGAAGVTADQVNKLAESLSKQTNYADDAILSGQNLLLTFTNIKGPVLEQATVAMLDMAAAMGTDAKGSAIQLGKALNNPIDGISALTRVGVTFSEEQKQVIQTMVETGHVADAQKVILAELAKEFGGSAKAQADPIIQMKNALNEAAEAIGKELYPYVKKLADKLRDFAENTLPKVIDRLKEIVNFFIENKEAIAVVAGIILGALTPAILAAAASFVTLAVSLAPFIITGAIIGGIVAGILWIIKHWEDIKTKAEEIWGSIKDFFVGIWESITGFMKTVWGSIKDFFVGIWESITEVFKFGVALAVGVVLGIFDAMGIDIIAVFDSIKQFLSDTWETIKMVFQIALDELKAIWDTVWGAIVDVFKPIWDAIKSVIQAGWNWIKERFEAFAEPIKKAWNGLWDGLTSGVTAAWEVVKSVIKSSINWIIGKINTVIDAINAVARKGAGVIGFSAPQIGNIPLLANGGIVTSPTLAMIGEGGEPEAVIPLSKLAGIGAGNGGIMVNINGGTYLSENAAGELGDMIINKLRQNMRI